MGTGKRSGGGGKGGSAGAAASAGKRGRASNSSQEVMEEAATDAAADAAAEAATLDVEGESDDADGTGGSKRKRLPNGLLERRLDKANSDKVELTSKIAELEKRLAEKDAPAESPRPATGANAGSKVVLRLYYERYDLFWKLNGCFMSRADSRLCQVCQVFCKDTKFEGERDSPDRST